jgi:hypothetical protein
MVSHNNNLYYIKLYNIFKDQRIYYMIFMTEYIISKVYQQYLYNGYQLDLLMSHTTSLIPI